jgi:hypothetical protein
MIHFALGWVAGIATLAGLAAGLMAWDDFQCERAVRQCPR